MSELSNPYVPWPLPYPIPRGKLEDGYYHLRPVDPAGLKELPLWPGG